jgi:ribonuclease P protein component
LHRQEFSSGEVSTTGPLLFVAKGVWLGALVPKRWARRAVTRNAIKRQIYSVSADFQHLFTDAAWLVRLRRDFARQEFMSAASDKLTVAVRDEVIALVSAGTRTS